MQDIGDTNRPVSQMVDHLVEQLIEREGGYVNNPADRGGPTCFGITQEVARANGYYGAMRQFPRDEAVAIYTRLYWLRPRYDAVARIAQLVAAELFDSGVNMGPAVATIFLQRALTALNRNGTDYGNYILDKASPGRQKNLMDDILAPRFIDPVAARKHLEALRWPDGAECPHCELINATAVSGGREGLYQCNSCREQFTVTVGTVFERSKVPLNKWLLCNHLLCAGKKGVSAHQIHRMLGVTYKTAWFMCHRIREAMKTEPKGPLGGPGKTVEADETFVGGKARNRAHRATAPKKMVVALIERGGEARSFHVANIQGNVIRAALVTSVDRASRLMTDNAHTYWAVGREFASHGSTIHSIREYAKGDIHSNTAENFFSIFKRGVIGTYHHLSAAHLHRYCAEFDFRYNTRQISDRERADISLKGIAGKRLTYRRTAALAA